MDSRAGKSKETESGNSEVAGSKEAAKPVESLTDSIMGILTSIMKVKDLRGAMSALVDAQRLKDEGKLTEARDLTLQIFDQLKKVGVETEDIPEKEQIKILARRGEYSELAKLIGEQRKEIDSKDQRGVWKQAADSARLPENDLRELNKEKKAITEQGHKNVPGEKAQENAARILELPRKSARQIRERAIALAVKETELDRHVTERLGELVEQLGGELAKREGTKFKKEWEQVKLEFKLGERSELSLADVAATKEKMGELWRKMTEDSEAMVEKVKQSALESSKLSGRKVTALEKAVAKAMNEKGISIAIAGRARELASVLESVEGKLKLGMSFDQIVRDLKPNEIGPVRRWLESMGKKKGDIGYDQILSEINDVILADPEGSRVLMRFLQNVQIGYEQQQWKREEEEMAARGTPVDDLRRRVMRGEPLVFDRPGRPHYGLEPGMSGSTQSGREFLEAMSGDADFVRQWLEAQSQEEVLEMQAKQKALYRAEMMNVNFEALKDEVDPEFYNYLDVESFEKGQVARLKKEFRGNPEHERRFQALWLQEMLYAQRMIAYEGVFQGAHYDARVTKYNTLMSIMDISTELKGFAKFQAQMFQMVDQQQNSFIDEEALSALTKPWTSQGPDFRLEHLLKVHRENMYVLDDNGKRKMIGNISTYDVVRKLKLRVEDPEERAKLGLVGNISRHYGTMMERHSDETKRAESRRIIFFSLLKDREIDVESLNDSQKNWLYNRYQSYLDEGINYMWTHKELHQAIGNASLEPNKYELPQALPEMLYKSDPKLVMDYFRIYSVGGASKDAFVYGDSGMRDHITMATNDYANHLLGDSVNTMGAPGIREAFFGGRTDETTNEHVTWFAETMKRAIFHFGYYNENRPLTMATRMGSEKEIKSATRRPDAEVIDILRGVRPPAGFVESINWGTTGEPGAFAKIVVDPKLVARLTGNELNAQQKWDLFVSRYGEDYFNMQSAGAKRMDHMTKYGLGSHFGWYKAYLDWQKAPVNNTKAVEMLGPAAAVNSAIVPYLVDNFMEYQAWANERLGRRELGGGTTERVAKNEKGQIQFDTSYGFLGEGDSEWPGLAKEDFANNRNILDPIQYRSINEASGIAGYQDELALKNLAEDFFRAGMMTEKSYSHWYKDEFMKSFFWQKKMGVLPNVWHWVTLDVFFDYMGNVWFGIPGHLLREAWWEPSKKQLEGIWKYFQS